MIYTAIPYRQDANLGRAYNEFMELLPSDGWAVFVDHDAMPTTGLWHAQFTEAIEFKPDAGAIVAMTNRCARSWQRAPGFPQDDVMDDHRAFGAERAKIRRLVDVTDTKGFGGVMFAVSKRSWSDVCGFVEGALGCTDHSFHHRARVAGKKIWMHLGIYAWHWRHKDAVDPTSAHAKVWNCPCRLPERSQPSLVVQL